MFKNSNTEKNNKRKKQSKVNKEETELWYSTYLDVWTNVKSKLDVSVIPIDLIQ